MPYVDPKVREALDEGVRGPHTVGELNYIVTRACRDFLRSTVGQGTLHYVDINEVVGVLECAKLELYRRVAAPHEDRMRDVNGDVY